MLTGIRRRFSDILLEPVPVVAGVDGAVAIVFFVEAVGHFEAVGIGALRSRHGEWWH